MIAAAQKYFIRIIYYAFIPIFMSDNKIQEYNFFTR